MVPGKRQVGVRQLRQNLSVYLRRVMTGETLEVTDRGRAVAVLAPLPDFSTPLGRLIASGRATAPSGDLLGLGRPAGRPVSRKASKALQTIRQDRL